MQKAGTVRCLIFVCCLLMLTACGKTEKQEKTPPPATLVSMTTAEIMKLEIREETVGTLEGLIDPTISAEVAARVLRVAARPGQTVKKGDLLVLLDPTDLALQRREAQAEVARVEALLENQQRILERNQALVEKNFISKNALDDVSTQKSVLQNQLEAARSRLASIEHNGSKTRVTAPVDGIVEKQIVSPGDFVNIGSPLMQIISNQRLRAHLPFPERVASKIRPGLKVRMSTPTSSETVISEVRDMKPLIGEGNRAIDVMADVVAQDGWQAGASVNGVVVLGETEAVVVPEQSVVLRPAGDVVYVIKEDKAMQRVVQAGLRQTGMVEIISGIAAGEIVAVDGASFLTDQAAVAIQRPAEERADPQAEADNAS